MIDLGKVALASIMLFFILYFFPMPTRVLTVAGLLCGLGVFLAILAVTGVLHYTDTDILLSGIFNDESKFKARLVKLVKLLNKENKNVTP